jgi:hypothetical protein
MPQQASRGNYLSDFVLRPAKARHFREGFIAPFKLSGYELLSIGKPYP